MRDPHNHQSRGFGFVSFQREDSAKQVLQNRYHDMLGKRVEVKSAVPVYIPLILLIEERNFTITCVSLSSSIFGTASLSPTASSREARSPGRRLHYYCYYYHYY